jgi:hypothetical protein
MKSPAQDVVPTRRACHRDNFTIDELVAFGCLPLETQVHGEVDSPL